MTIVKKYRQSNGTVVDAIFSDDGKQVKMNTEDGYIIWADASDEENLDAPVVSVEQSRIRRAAHDLRKITEQVEVLKRKEYPLSEPEPMSKELYQMLQDVVAGRRWR